MAEKIHIVVEPELKDFLPKYLENRKRDLQDLRSALTLGDFKTLQMTSHKIRGHALSYGFNPLSRICEQIENAVKESKSDTTDIIDSLLNEYADYIERVELN